MRNSRKDLPWQRRRKADQDARVKALEASALAQEASRLRKRESLQETREWMSLAATVIATGFAIVGFGIWIIETPDRARDREIDRNSIVQHAKDVVESYSARDVVEVSPALLEAMATLAREREWIQLSAKKEIRFWDVVLPCGGYLLSAPSIEFVKADISNSHLLMDPETLSIFGSQINFATLEIDDGLTSNKPMHIDVSESVLAYSSLNTSTSILAVRDLSLKSSSLKVGSGDLRPDVELEFNNFKIDRTFIWADEVQREGFASTPQLRTYLDAFFATAPEPAPEFGSDHFDAWRSKRLEDRAPLVAARAKQCLGTDHNVYKCDDPAAKIEPTHSEMIENEMDCLRPYPLDRRRAR